MFKKRKECDFTNYVYEGINGGEYVFSISYSGWNIIDIDSGEQREMSKKEIIHYIRDGILRKIKNTLREYA